MINYVIDASTAIKWYIPEPWHEKAVIYLRMLEQMKANLYAPDLIVSEIGNTLWKKCLTGELTSGEAREISDTIAEMFPVRLVDCTFLLPAAMEIATTYHINIYSSVYLALASIKNAILVTADRNLFKGVGHTVFKDLVVLIQEV